MVYGQSKVASNTEDLCDIQGFVATNDPGTGTCTYTFDGSYKEQVDSLEIIRTISLVLNIVSTIFAIFYLIWEGHRRHLLAIHVGICH